MLDAVGVRPGVDAPLWHAHYLAILAKAFMRVRYYQVFGPVIVTHDDELRIRTGQHEVYHAVCLAALLATTAKPVVDEDDDDAAAALHAAAYIGSVGGTMVS